MASDGGGVPFEIQLSLCTAWQDEAGELWFEGVASSTGVDRQKERMSVQAISAMSRCHGVPLMSSHSGTQRTQLGTVEECWVDSEKFRVRGKLDVMAPEAWRLYRRVRDGQRYALSVGGRVTEAHWEESDGEGDRVKVIDQVQLDHIAVCRPSQAANPDTHLRVILRGGSDATGGEVEGSEGRGGLQSVTRSLRGLWKGLFGSGSGGGSGEGMMGLQSELAVLRGDMAEVRESLAALSKAMDTPGEGSGVQDDGEAEPASDRREWQCTQSIEGQEKHGGNASHIWKGVL